MDEENRKEILTKDIVKGEIKDLCIHNIKSDLFLIVLFIVLFAFSVLLWANHFTGAFLIAITVTLLLLFRIVLGFRYLIKILRMSKSEKFIIRKERLINKIPAEKQYAPIRDKAVLIKPWVLSADAFWLVFSLGKYGIPIGMNYQWSQNCKMDNLSVYRTSDIGDEFYLVIFNGKIIIAYNSKMFDFH